MKIEIPDKIIDELVEANILQNSGSIQSAELRGNQVQRIEYQVVEIIAAIIAKEMRKMKYIK